MNEKQITVILGDKVHDLAVAPSTSTADVRRQINLPPEYLLSKRDGLPFGEQEDIWSRVQPGEKLFASPPAVVGLLTRGAR
ncbi:MAG: hypothetical protein WAZ94_08480 [Phycisphaerales bacterium]